MVALPGALGGFHLAQQGVHFRQRQPPVGADRAMAGHGRQQRIPGVVDAARAAMLAEVGEHVAQQRFDIAVRQQRGHAAQEQRLRPAALHLEAEPGQRARLAFGDIGFALGHHSARTIRVCDEAFANLDAGCSQCIERAFVDFLDGFGEQFGVVLSGRIIIEMSDVWGNNSVLSSIDPGGTFAEAYACISGEPLMVNVIAAEDSTVLLLNAHQVLTPCSRA